MNRLINGALIIFGLLLLVILPSVYDDLMTVARWLIYGTIIAAGLVLLGGAVFMLFVLRQKYRLIRASADAAVAEAKQKAIIIHNDGYGMTHKIDVLTNHSQNLTLDARAYRNGHFEVPHQIEQENLKLILASKHAGASRIAIEQSQPQLTATIQPSPSLDLLRIFTQPTQSYAVIGGQQVGKTFQARRVAQYWLDSGIKPLVIGPKWDAGEWGGCALFGGEYNFERVAQGMRIVKKLAEDRHTDKEHSHKQHSIQPVFFDDWTAIRAKLEKEAEDFILDATTLYASVNIVLYFIIHLDTSNAWGVGRVGAALHQNFIKLRIEPGFDNAGMIDRSKNVGWLIMPGQPKAHWRQIALFTGTGQPVLLPDLVIGPGEDVATITREDDDAKFVRLVSEGKSRNAASLEAYGRRYAGDLVERGRRLLGK